MTGDSDDSAGATNQLPVSPARHWVCIQPTQMVSGLGEAMIVNQIIQRLGKRTRAAEWKRVVVRSNRAAKLSPDKQQLLFLVPVNL